MATFKESIRNAALAVAKMAGYDAAKPSITREPHTRYNTNPNSISAQVERVTAMWNAEYLAKNSDFAIGYIRQRLNYCTPQGWLPATGDPVLNKEVREYFDSEAETLGINCSLYEAFGRAANVELPVRGDSALVWTRDQVGNLKLMEVSSDQIGELYTFRVPMTDIPKGWTYFAGMFFDEHGTRQAFKIYERGFNQVYTNPHEYPAHDVIYMQDNLLRGVRGMTIFHGAIVTLSKSDQLFQYGLDSAQKQAKVGVVNRNNYGAPLDPFSYDSRTTPQGNMVYIEKNFDGAQTEYQFIGDEFAYMKTESPGQELIDGCRYADERVCLSLGFPYSFLVNSSEVGGAPSRLEIGKAGKEIARITKMHERHFKRIAYTVIMDAVEKGIFSGPALKYKLTNGQALFPTLPTADAFRDDQSDIKAIRAGIDSPQRVLGRYREDMHEILDEKKEFAVEAAKRVQDANRELEESGYEPTVSIADIAQNSDNPQQSAIGETIDKTGKAPAPANS